MLTVVNLIPVKEGIKSYSVRKINGKFTVSGTGHDPQWKHAMILTDFGYPWESEAPPPTTFRALHDDQWLYCLFEVKDEKVHILRDKDHKSEVASSSRAEIFFRIDERLSPYYCLEIDPIARVFDYKATYHRNFDLTWSWPQGHLIVKSDRTADGYTVEIAVSKASLKELGVLRNNMLEAGLYRGDCSPRSEGEYDFKWISWVRPDSKTPDFHIPSSFGVLRLE